MSASSPDGSRSTSTDADPGPISGSTPSPRGRSHAPSGSSSESASAISAWRSSSVELPLAPPHRPRHVDHVVVGLDDARDVVAHLEDTLLRVRLVVPHDTEAPGRPTIRIVDLKLLGAEGPRPVVRAQAGRSTRLVALAAFGHRYVPRLDAGSASGMSRNAPEKLPVKSNVSCSVT